jgi:uridine kinase
VADLNDIVETISNLPGPIKIIGVDGHSAAGKSTLAATLAGQFERAVVIHGDDFYRVMDEQRREGLSPAEGAEFYYDWERQRDVLDRLSAGRTVSYRPYDWAANELAAEPVTVAAAPVIIMEGLFVSRPELAACIDLALLVTTDPGARRSRQRARADATPQWWDRWDAAERWYFENVRPANSFDLIIAGC